MQTRPRIACVVTARPSYARVQTLLRALQSHCDLQVLCVASALVTRYGAIVDQIRADGFSVTYVSASLIDGDDPSGLARTMGLTTLDLATHFRHTAPDAVVTIADRAETLATAVAASYQHIPLVHLQGGEVTGSIDDKVRDAVSQLADLHLVAHVPAAERLVRAGVRGPVVVTGCPSIDLALAVDAAPISVLPGRGDTLDLMQPFVLALYHPVTTHAAQAGLETAAVQQAIEAFGLPVVWFWPNVDTGSEAVSKAVRTWTPRVPAHIVRQVSPQDFVRLLRQCAVLVGNSSAGIREGAALGTPVVNVGDRQQGRIRAENVYDSPVVPDAIRVGLEDRWRWARQTSTLYGDGHAGPRAAAVLLESVC